MTYCTISLNNKIIKQFAMEEGETVTIGRGAECSVTIDNTAISRKHVSLFQSSGICFVSDLGSTNGTFLNGKKVKKDEPVTDKDVVTFGKFALTLADEAATVGPQISSTADPMDLDEETVFVGGKAPAPKKKIFPKRGGGPRLRVVAGGGEPQELSLAGKSSVKIGKESNCDLRIKGFLVARAQCYIIKRDKGFFLVPQRSWAGTFVNDIKVGSETRLRPGDVIRIRGNTIRFD